MTAKARLRELRELLARANAKNAMPNDQMRLAQALVNEAEALLECAEAAEIAARTCSHPSLDAALAKIGGSE